MKKVIGIVSIFAVLSLNVFAEGQNEAPKCDQRNDQSRNVSAEKTDAQVGEKEAAQANSEI